MSVTRKLIGLTRGAAIAEGWDLSNATFNGTPPFGRFSVAAQEYAPLSVFFKPDGTKMYVVGSAGGVVNEYNLSIAWDVTTSSYLQDFSVAAQEYASQSLFFKPDGTKMYIVGVAGDVVNEYNLSTPWDISTSSYLQNFSVAAQEYAAVSVFFKPDGTKMYIVGDVGADVNEYNLSIAWDVTTASYLQNFSVAVQESQPKGLFFKPDGTKMYVMGGFGGVVNEYNLSIAWDVTTSSYLQNFSVATQEYASQSLFFKPDGLKMYTIGGIGDAVYEYNLSAAWDVATAAWVTPTSRYFSVYAQEMQPNGVFFKPDGTKMYVMGGFGGVVNEYNLSIAWDVTTASYLQDFSVAAQEYAPESVFFKPDGTKMYVLGGFGDDVNEYNLSIAWDISTSSYLQNFSVAVQETQPNGLFFKPDGTKMYVVGSAGDDVNEYNLSTPWDISTSSYLQNFSVAAQDLAPVDVFFKPDGTKMYIVGIVGDDVNEYNLSTPWDISTSSYLQNFSVAVQETQPNGLFFKPDGTKMYVIGREGYGVYEYDL
jgi:sugar lactone lactonase YvrE